MIWMKGLYIDKMAKLVFCFLFILLVHTIAVSQQPHSINYSTVSGLPSSEVYTVIQDNKGYMWFGTDNGIARFNGYTFTNFDLRHGLDHLEINKFHLDSKGILWASSMQGYLYYYEGGRFHAFQFNELLDEERKRNATIYFCGISKGYFWLACQDGKGGILKINIATGKKVYFPFKKSKYRNIVAFKDGNNLFTYKNIENNHSFSRDSIGINVFDKDNEVFLLQNIIKAKKASQEIIFKRQKGFGLIVDEELYDVNKKPIKIGSVVGAYNGLKIINGKIYLKGKADNGLKIYDNSTALEQGKVYQQYMMGYEISDVIKDKNNGTWITTINDGVFYQSNDQITVFKNNFKDENQFTSIIPLDSHTCYATTFYGKVQYITGNTMATIFDINTFIKDIALVNGDLHFNKYKLDIFSNKLSIFFNTVYNLDQKSTAGILYGANQKNILKHNLISKKINPLSDLAAISPHRVHSFLSKDSTDFRWVGTSGGLYTLNSDSIQDIENKPYELMFRINAMCFLDSTHLLIGTKGRGLIVYNYKSNCVERLIDNSDGLSSNFITYLTKNNEDILVATPNGLDVLKHRGKGDVFFSKHFDKSHGLPSNEIKKAVMIDGTIWAATYNGVVRMNAAVGDTSTFSPIVEQILINNKEVSIDLTEPFELRPNENTIKFVLANLDYAMGKNVNY